MDDAKRQSLEQKRNLFLPSSLAAAVVVVSAGKRSVNHALDRYQLPLCALPLPLNVDPTTTTARCTGPPTPRQMVATGNSRGEERGEEGHVSIL